METRKAVRAAASKRSGELFSLFSFLLPGFCIGKEFLRNGGGIGRGYAQVVGRTPEPATVRRKRVRLDRSNRDLVFAGDAHVAQRRLVPLAQPDAGPRERLMKV